MNGAEETIGSEHRLKVIRTRQHYLFFSLSSFEKKYVGRLSAERSLCGWSPVKLAIVNTTEPG